MLDLILTDCPQTLEVKFEVIGDELSSYDIGSMRVSYSEIKRDCFTIAKK